jgi:hypothetical protein
MSLLLVKVSIETIIVMIILTTDTTIIMISTMTMSAIIKLIKSKTVGKRRYEYAADLTNQIIARKKKEGGGKLKHSVTWYANKVAGQVPGVDTKTLMRMIDDE